MPEEVRVENDDEDGHEQDREHDRRNKTEAGVARGAARSLGTTAARLPAVGRLPLGRPAVTVPRPPVSVHRGIMPRRLPVKQVAKISDRVSQGIDLYDLAAESSARESNLLRIRSFALNLVKSTLLGLAVFEAYGEFVERMAPPAKNQETKDPYARASVATHAFAGSLGGCAHGIVGTVWETASASPEARRSVFRNMPRMIVHHGLAHSVLFGGYEGTKRLLLSYLLNNKNNIEFEGSEPVTRVEFLGCVTLAGGLAGQAQHLVSHYSEQVITPTTPGPIRWTVPTLRPLLIAFIPSGIAFVALEYGRNE